METQPPTESSFVDTARDIGVIVRSRRTILGLSQEQLATRAGVGRRFVVDLEAGKQTVQADALFKVCAAVDVELLARRPRVDEFDLLRALRKMRAREH